MPDFYFITPVVVVLWPFHAKHVFLLTLHETVFHVIRFVLGLSIELASQLLFFVPTIT